MPLRLVLIEDHQALREGLELLLGREGIEVLGAAGTADEGRELVERLAPDVSLIDISLGEDSGIELTAQLIDADPKRRIVLYTGSNEIELLIKGLGCGARGYALKEGTQAELRSALHIRNAMNKLEANTRVHAIAIALREGFISAPTSL